MNQKFQAEVTQKDDICYIKLSGVIDEDNGLAALVDQVSGIAAIINAGEIERINSCGVRDWVNWLGRIEKQNINVVLVECSPAIVAQINLVHNFAGKGAVKSFFAPYFCPSCDLEKVLLIEAAEIAGQTPPRAPTCRCDECDGVMDFDDMEESYFAFLSSGRKLVQDPKIEAALSELIPANGTGDRKVRSRVGLTPVSSTGGSPLPSSGPALPSVPSLPAIVRPAASGPTFSSTGTGAGSRPGSRPGYTTLDGNVGGQLDSVLAAAASPGKSRAAVLLVVALLLLAIGLLAYVIVGGAKPPLRRTTHTMPQTALETFDRGA